MDTVIEYLFGTGDGALTHWSSQADLDLNGDGTLDAVSLDFDGDGIVDDAMWDSNGDGIADLAALDLDDDGTAESTFRDGGRGAWEIAAGKIAAGETTPAQSMLDTDGDGVDDLVLIDSDGDGYADSYRESTSMG